MPKPKRGPRLGAGPQHQKLLLGNLAQELFRHGRITTTEAKARTLRPYAEKLITKAKRGDLAARRDVLRRVHDRDVVAYLFDDIAPRFADRPGGYTRILKLGPRPGDSAPMALIELVERAEGSAEEVIEEGKAQRGRGIFGRRRRRREPEVLAGAGYFDADDDEYGDMGADEGDDEGDDEELAPDAAGEDVEQPAPGPSDGERGLDEVKDADQAPGPVPERTAPDVDPSRQDEDRPMRPDAGDTTGG